MAFYHTQTAIGWPDFNEGACLIFVPLFCPTIVPKLSRAYWVIPEEALISQVKGT